MRAILAFLFFIFGSGSSPVLAFLPRDGVAKNRPGTSLRLTEAEIPQVALTARADCVFWFFGASGAAGIARSAFPKMFNKYSTLQKLKDVGPTKGGEMLGINTLACGFPQDVSRADVQQVLNNPLSVDEIVKKFPVPEVYLASKGYLTADAFTQANADANPLAVRAVFDTFATSTNMAHPQESEAKLDRYKENVEALKSDLFIAKILGLAAIITLLFLLGIADIIAFTDVYHGWFPDWPGGENFPFGMLKPNGSPFKIPNYWI